MYIYHMHEDGELYKKDEVKFNILMVSKCIEWMIKSELKCCGCNGEMSPPLKIFQCELGHNQCQQCHIQIEEKVTFIVHIH